MLDNPKKNGPLLAAMKTAAPFGAKLRGVEGAANARLSRPLRGRTYSIVPHERPFMRATDTRPPWRDSSTQSVTHNLALSRRRRKSVGMDMALQARWSLHARRSSKTLNPALQRTGVVPIGKI